MALGHVVKQCMLTSGRNIHPHARIKILAKGRDIFYKRMLSVLKGLLARLHLLKVLLPVMGTCSGDKDIKQ